MASHSDAAAGTGLKPSESLLHGIGLLTPVHVAM